MNGIRCRCCSSHNLGGRHPQWSPPFAVDPVAGQRFLQDCRQNLKLSELGSSTLVLNAQEMATVVPGGFRMLQHSWPDDSVWGR